MARVDAVRELVALVLVGAVATTALVSVSPDAPAPPVREPLRLVASSSRACNLTPQEEQKAVETFHNKLMPVLMHPRCFNCHGGVDPRVDKNQGGHLGGAVPDTSKACSLCHDLTGWLLPPKPMMWLGKSERDLCMLFKQMERTPAGFVAHVTTDHFPNAPEFQVVKAAFKGDAALSNFGITTYEDETGQPFKPDPPKVSHAQFILDSRDWAYTLGDGFGVLPDCGCKIRQSAWEGTVEATFTRRDPRLGLLIESTKSTLRLELDTTMTSDEDAYWEGVAGAVNWSVSMTGGECISSGSGTVPVGLGADLNPMVRVQISRDAAGAQAYAAFIGPFPDAYNPRIVWRCRENPKIRPGIPLTLNLWWNVGGRMPLGAIGKTMKGSYKTAISDGEMVWLWNLKYVEAR